MSVATRETSTCTVAAWFGLGLAQGLVDRAGLSQVVPGREHVRVLAADVRQRLELRLQVEDVEAVAAEEREPPRGGERVPEPLEPVGGFCPSVPAEHVDHLAEHPHAALGLTPLRPVEQRSDDVLEALGNASGRS